MRLRALSVLFLTLALTACTSISPEAEQGLAKPVDCETAEADVAALEAEKASVAKQAAAGVRTILPAAAVVGILRRDMRNRAKVATGAYNRELEAKIDEIRQKCGMWPAESDGS